jgi:cyclase
MACKRIIACLDVMNGRTVKGTRFENLKDLGDPAAMALYYQEQGADEITLLDITASPENRTTRTEWVKNTAKQLSIPLTAGGGVKTLEDAAEILDAGADRVTVNTQAVKNPGLITQIANRYGSQCCTLAIDTREKSSKENTVLINGGRTDTKIELISWIRTAQNAGAGEILLTSWNRDGTKKGFHIAPTKRAAEATSLPLIASGGAGCPGHFTEVFTKTKATAALAAGILHRGEYTIRQIKETLKQEGIEVRPC